MNSKKAILNRLRQSNRKASIREFQLPPDQDIYRDFPAPAELFRLFNARVEELYGRVYPAETTGELCAALTGFLKQFSPGRVIAHRFQMIEELSGHDGSFPELLRFPDEPPDSPEFSRYDVGITAATCLVARTGSVIIDSRTCGGRRMSVLPPVHVVLARETQLSFSLEDALAGITAEPDKAGFYSIISGPSRTSDIEKKLVLGAHGPRELHIFILRDI